MNTYHILIADTDENSLDTMRTPLEEAGFTVSEAIHLQSVLSLLELEKVDILLMDVSLGEKDGRSAEGVVRGKAGEDSPQVLVMSHLQRELDEAIARGADDVVKKPVDEGELLLRVRAAVGRLQERDKLRQEKEFFRQAVKQEEAFSSRILEQHMNLKKAFKDIEQINRDLERSNRQLERVARYDMLSGLLNRLSLFALLDAEIDRAERTGMPLAGAMFDLDHFKELNDTYGHQAGDDAIRAVGRRLIEVMRKYDHAGRYGGEEFFIILPNTRADQAVGIAERFRQEVESMPIQCGNRDLRITASFGVSEFVPGEKKETWLDRTDRAMYLAKQQGRNAVRKG